MRKIENEMLTAIANERDWQSGNTRVSNTDHGLIVRLHGNKIAQIEDSKLYLTTCGYETRVTKSRLNAILSLLMPGSKIFAKEFIWFIQTRKYCAKFSKIDSQPINL
tara:strand:- start:54 stop:374 length:321 start_codon:yes stop_codon:yes gene_type:complete